MEPFIGQIQAFGFNFAPRNWALCNGQLLAISQFSALFSLLGTTYGGDGRTTFALPDLRGRSIRHVGNGPGLNPIIWGQRGGSNTVTLTQAQMPSHNHTVNVVVSNAQGEESNASGQVIANHDGAFNEEGSLGSTLGGVSSANAGGSQSFSIDNPYVGIYVSIALVGIFPSRN